MAKISGVIELPGDKSISHRAALFSALIDEPSRFSNFNYNRDCRATLHCLQKLGIEWQVMTGELQIRGRPLKQWQEPDTALNAENSGTTTRLISALLSHLPFKTQLVGDASLSGRPMKRIIDPLSQMGARIKAKQNNYLPLNFHPVSEMNGMHYTLPIASAQVKSAILLAGLFARGKTFVIENTPSRDHTERLLQLPAELQNDGSKTIVSSVDRAIPNFSMRIPGDFSSAAFFIAAALLLPRSELRIDNVSLNPTRTGLLFVLQRMGVQFDIEPIRNEPEPAGRLIVRSSALQNVAIEPSMVPNIIDEIPIMCIIASQSEGSFVLHGAEELRFKESDRIKAMADNLRAVGIEVEEYEDGLAINGPQTLTGGKINTYGDHRIAMAFAVADLLATDKIVLDDPDCVDVSFPDFWSILKQIVV
ncbi:MAG: 3-phosphoshikimate 1-carboxyvinyltransferase [Caldithrix sp.]|nr:3-phosphoshikimate 1-carboxyvinyltransferase [Caldithrix sp.]